MVVNYYAIPGIKNFNDTDNIIYKICDYFKVSEKELKSKFKGKREIVYARDWLIWFLICEANMNFVSIGRLINRHWSSVIYSKDKTKENLYNEKSQFHEKYRTDYSKLLKLFS